MNEPGPRPLRRPLKAYLADVVSESLYLSHPWLPGLGEVQVGDMAMGGSAMDFDFQNIPSLVLSFGRFQRVLLDQWSLSLLPLTPLCFLYL